MSHGDSTSVDIGLLQKLEPMLSVTVRKDLGANERHGCKRFVDFDEIDLVNRQSRPAESFPYRERRYPGNPIRCVGFPSRLYDGA